MQQRGMRQMSYDTEAGRVTAVYRVLDMRRSIWSLGSMMDSGCDEYFTKDRRWIAQKKKNGTNLQNCLREREALWNSIRCHQQRSNEQRRQECRLDLESLALRRETRWPVTPSAVERKLHKTSGHAPCRRWCRWCAAVRAADEPHLRKQQPETDESVSRTEFDSAELEREEDQTLSTSSLNAFDDGSENSTATLCSTKAFSEQVAFVEVLRHNVVMLHSDQEPVLVQLSKNCTEQTFRTNVGETWSKNQSSEPEKN